MTVSWKNGNTDAMLRQSDFNDLQAVEIALAITHFSTATSVWPWPPRKYLF